MIADDVWCRMTAEIAILNKTAVALAADSAVTLSVGSQEQKIFDSADKLFELSCVNPIGIMIYNGMSYMDVPLPTLIRQFRASCSAFETVSKCADAFLEFLHKFGATAPESIKNDAAICAVDHVIADIGNRVAASFQHLIQKESFGDDFQAKTEALVSRAIDLFERVYDRKEPASFVGPSDDKDFHVPVDLIRKRIKARIMFATEEHEGRILKLTTAILNKAILSPNRTGIVIAGFGTKELFPTLISFEVDGLGNQLKYLVTNKVDIDRSGVKARVQPFAQKEMVERFLYGLDDEIQRDISLFCKQTLPDVHAATASKLSFGDDTERVAFEAELRATEDAFMEGLRDRAFERIRSQSQAEIDDMVEFMPKPEMAKMAEALVNLTSIKRRVSRGMETVGGPIDVAVISQSEGFVWVRRKHYFPPELNSRYFDRVRDQNIRLQQEGNDATIRKPRKARPSRGAKRVPEQE